MPQINPIRAVLILAEYEERHQLEMMQPYCERNGYEIVSTVPDLTTAIGMVEHGLADRVVMASRQYLPVPFESVTCDIPLGPGHHRGDRPRRLR